ncbi:hypothetical protein [Pararhodobacter sp.]|uniref:hypothetical protein n=1 Tax=Pararhodobacter sp. TaxID=2127056 RepID=UPI002AFE8A8F|nr:hypothetical protein [Pararhodobacter sp.]
MKLALATLAALALATPAAADLDCTNTAGHWTGTMEGALNGATAMDITAQCRVTWTLPDGRINDCRYTNRGQNIEYSCSLGSRGSVAFDRGNIIMENIYTAARHGAYVVNVSRVSR